MPEIIGRLTGEHREQFADAMEYANEQGYTVDLWFDEGGVKWKVGNGPWSPARGELIERN